MNVDESDDTVLVRDVYAAIAEANETGEPPDFSDIVLSDQQGYGTPENAVGEIGCIFLDFDWASQAQWYLDDLKDLTPERYEELSGGAEPTEEELVQFRRAVYERSKGESTSLVLFLCRYSARLENGEEGVVFYIWSGSLSPVPMGAEFLHPSTDGPYFNLGQIKDAILESGFFEAEFTQWYWIIGSLAQFPEQGDLEAWLDQQEASAVEKRNQYLYSLGVDPK